jgi:hypothetical protein
MPRGSQASQRYRLQIEQLEDRWVPSTIAFNAPTGGVPNNMLLHFNNNKVELLNNGVVVDSQAIGGLSSVAINGAPGANNTLTVDFSFGGVFAVPGGIAFNNTVGTGGTDALIVIGTAGADAVSLSASSLTVDGSAISFSGLAALQVNTLGGGDTVTAGSLAPTVTTTVDAGTGSAGLNVFNLNVTGDFAGNLTTRHFDTVTGTVTGNFTGQWSVQGSGTINNLTVGGTVTSTGTVMAEDVTNITVMGDVAGTIVASVPAGTSGTGTISTLTIAGSITDTGLVQGKDLGTVKIVNDLNGGVIAHGSGTITNLMVDGSIGASGTVVSEDITNITVMRDVAGSVTVTSTAAGEGDIDGMTIGGNFIGTIIVQNILAALAITGTSTGTITTGSAGTVSAAGATAGSPVLTITQGGVQRTLVATRADNGNPTPPSVKFAYFYDGALAVPQVSVRVTNGSATVAPVRFDLKLVSSTAAKFNLGLLYASGASAIRDVAVAGDVVATVDPKALMYLGLPSSTGGGVKLPLDNLGCVAALGNVTAGTVQVKSLQAVAFGSITAGGVTTPAQSATHVDAAGLLAAGSATVPASDTYFVPFEFGQPVAFFLNTGSGVFDAKDVLFTGQINNNQSVTATVTAVNGVITKIALNGSGGSIFTAQPITTSITSTGPLGDLTLQGSNGVPDVTVPNVFGNVNANGPFFGIFQTTTGDLGAPIRDSTGTIVGTTIINTNQGITGKIISRGNLVSKVQSQKGITSTAVIAAQGDFGVAYVNAAGQLVRFGGLLSNGQFAGDLVVLGNALGDLVFKNGVNGRVAVKGRAIPGLASTRIGILGNLLVSGNIDATAAIVSAGLIGDAAGGTLFSSGAVKGILAAEGPINIGGVGNTSGATIIPNATGANKAAIDAIFAAGGTPPAFDLVPGSLDLGGLTSILTALNKLHVGTDGNLTVT